MTCSPQMQNRGKARSRRHAASRGFSLIELVFVVLIGLVLSSMAVPVIQSSFRYFQLRSAVSSLTGAIQSTRYQAVFHGCSYKIVFTAATYNYQVSSEAPLAAAPTVCAAAFTNVGAAIPLTGNGITLNADATFTFSPSGAVTPGAGNAVAGIVLTQTHIQSPETITVSNYGKVLVTP
jgi:prepilin-type N-terminal cleavage/methylation domain-containing protein